jgi:hypothetical protein
MTEIERIINNINGEFPKENYRYIIVENIDNPEEALEIFKQSILAILKNKHIAWDNVKWEKLLPKEVVAFTNQLEADDYKDELLSQIPNMVYKIIEVRDWEWYSSQLYEDGFEIVILGNDAGGTALRLLHHQGIPHASMASGDDTTKYNIIRSGLDVLTYKKWNPETLELKKRT